MASSGADIVGIFKKSRHPAEGMVSQKIMSRASESRESRRVRRIYEERPYPAADESALKDRRWRLAPTEWINALWRPGRQGAAPKRILVAGCGTGREALRLSRRFTRAQIVAVDFSPRSIGIAQDLQRGAPEMRGIRFIVADLVQKRLPVLVGGSFDFISCHGVLSYIPAPKRALANLARCLKPDGALYLGVNGADHSSVADRRFLAAFGFDMAEFSQRADLRSFLKLSDGVRDAHGLDRLANRKESYLAGDLFGSVIHNLPLSEWISIAREAGFHLQGSTSSYCALRRAMEDDFPRLLIPRSRAEVCELLDILCPAGFHRLLFTGQAPAKPPWLDHDALLGWRPVLTGLYKTRLPKKRRAWRQLRRVTLESKATNTGLDWQMPEWEVEILRQSDGSRTLRALLATIPVTVPPGVLQQQLYVLYQLLVIELFQ